MPQRLQRPLNNNPHDNRIEESDQEAGDHGRWPSQMLGDRKRWHVSKVERVGNESDPTQRARPEHARHYGAILQQEAEDHQKSGALNRVPDRFAKHLAPDHQAHGQGEKGRREMPELRLPSISIDRGILPEREKTLHTPVNFIVHTMQGRRN